MPDSDQPASSGPASQTGLPWAPGQPAMPEEKLEHILQGVMAVHQRIAELERLAGVGDRAAGKVLIPAWKRVTAGESRWRVAFAVTGAIALQLPLPGRLVLIRPAWVLPVLEVVMIATLTAMNPSRLNRETRMLRYLSLSIAGVLSLANAWAAAHLVVGLVQGTEGSKPGPLLITGGVIWLTNIIIFGLWYWEFDRGGPVARANATHACPDFLFPQMTSPDLAEPEWEPVFGDYLYVSFTNATAFSPTDTLPMSLWAKRAMTLQALVSIVTVALVIARAVNILN